MFDTVDEISRLSSEYYYLMPKIGMDYVRLPPIDQKSNHSVEMLRVTNTLEFEVAERLLLGAMYRKKEINPLDYLYRAMNCQIEALKPDDPESGHIIQYIYNSPSASSHK